MPPGCSAIFSAQTGPLRTYGSNGSFGSSVTLIQRILVDVVAAQHASRFSTHLGLSANVGEGAGPEPVNGSAQTP